MRIQPLTPGFSRWQDLLDLILAAFSSMDGRIDPPSSAHALTVQGLADKAQREIGFVAVHEGRLSGCMFLRPEPSALYIGKLVVSPDMQGRGIGRALLDQAHRQALQLGLPSLRLETRIELVDNHEVFGHWGFRRSREGRHPGFERTTFIEMISAVMPVSGPEARGSADGVRQ